jgi:chromosome segregation ATPase
MHNKEDGTPRQEFEDAATGEHPVSLESIADDSPTTEAEVDTALMAEAAAEAAGIAAQDRTAATDEAGVGGWLAHLENEIARLHGRWQHVEEQFNYKDALVAELRDEVRLRDAAASELAVQLEEAKHAHKALEETLGDKHVEISNLTMELDARGAALAEHEARLAATANEREVAERELTATRAEVARLGAAVEREQAASGAAAGRNEELLQAQAALNSRVQELEAYIDGRADRWSTLKGEMAKHKVTILRLEKLVKTHDHAIEEANRHKRELDATIMDLERKNAELAARRAEREAAYEALERELAEERRAREGLMTDLAQRIAASETLAARAEENRALVASLEEGVASRDATITRLETELAADRSLATELGDAKASLTRAAAELQEALDEQIELAEALRREARATAARVEALEQDLAAREAELAQLRAREGGQVELTARLTAELAEKQSSLDLLQRSVRRISDLGASVAELERRFESGPHSRPKADLEPSIAPETAGDGDPEELLPIESFMALEIVDGKVAEVTSAETGVRKLVGFVAGERVSYPLGKSEMTIGRSKGSDIRIPSHYVSRAHARISTRGIATTIEDIGSKNGIFVNDERVTRRVLRDGDIVVLAKELELRFVDARH